MSEQDEIYDDEIYDWCRRKWLGTKDWLDRFGDGKGSVRWPQSEIDRKIQDHKMYARIGNMTKERLNDAD